MPKTVKGSTYGVIALVLAGMLLLYRYNMTKRRAAGTAQPGQYSDSGDYANISPMKHDIFKQLTLDIVLIGLVFVLLEVVGGVESFYDASDFLSFKNFREFRLSIVGGSMISVIGYTIYYQFVEPYIVNRLPRVSKALGV
jgi:hypothetical protein